MNGNIYKSAGVTIGIVVGLVVAFALIRLANYNRKAKAEYDDMKAEASYLAGVDAAEVDEKPSK